MLLELVGKRQANKVAPLFYNNHFLKDRNHLQNLLKSKQLICCKLEVV